MSPVLRTLSLALAFTLGALPAAAQQTVTLPAKDRVLPGTPRPLFAIGAAEGEHWELLDGVAALAFDARDNLYLLDRGNARVLVFDPAGRFVRQIGRKGEGPGELQIPLGMALTADGSVVVSDLGRGGYSVFSPDGAFLHNVMNDPAQGRMGISRLAPLASGGIVYQGSSLVVRGPGQPPVASDSVTFFAHALTKAAKPVPIARVPSPRPVVRSSGNAPGGRFNVTVGNNQVFAPTVRWAALADGHIGVAFKDAYELTVFGRDGKADRVVRRGVRPRRVTEKDRDAARERRRASLQSGDGVVMMRTSGGGTSMRAAGPAPEERIRAALGQMEFAETIPVIRAVAADGRGRLWIQRVGADPYGPGPIDLVASSGSYIGTLRPQELPDAFSRSGRTAYIQEDPDLGIQRVVVKQLSAGW